MAAVATSISTVRTSIPLMTGGFASSRRAPSDFRLDFDFIGVQGVGPHLRRLARGFFQTGALAHDVNVPLINADAGFGGDRVSSAGPVDRPSTES